MVLPYSLSHRLSDIQCFESVCCGIFFLCTWAREQWLLFAGTWVMWGVWGLEALHRLQCKVSISSTWGKGCALFSSCQGQALEWAKTEEPFMFGRVGTGSSSCWQVLIWLPLMSVTLLAMGVLSNLITPSNCNQCGGLGRVLVLDCGNAGLNPSSTTKLIGWLSARLPCRVVVRLKKENPHESCPWIPWGEGWGRSYDEHLSIMGGRKKKHPLPAHFNHITAGPLGY